LGYWGRKESGGGGGGGVSEKKEGKYFDGPKGRREGREAKGNLRRSDAYLTLMGGRQ